MPHAVKITNAINPKWRAWPGLQENDELRNQNEECEHRTFNPPQADLWRKLKKYGMRGMDEHGRTRTDMDNGKIEYFDP